jgi:hypothetical protein
MFIISNQVYAEETLFSGSKWTTLDTILQSTYAFTLIADWAQTRQICKFDNLQESNPIMGRNPSNKTINIFFVGNFLIHTTISYFLPKPYRTVWQAYFIGVEKEAIEHNKNSGIHINFGGHTIY